MLLLTSCMRRQGRRQTARRRAAGCLQPPTWAPWSRKPTERGSLARASSRRWNPRRSGCRRASTGTPWSSGCGRASRFLRSPVWSFDSLRRSQSSAHRQRWLNLNCWSWMHSLADRMLFGTNKICQSNHAVWFERPTLETPTGPKNCIRAVFVEYCGKFLSQGITIRLKQENLVGMVVGRVVGRVISGPRSLVQSQLPPIFFQENLGLVKFAVLAKNTEW